jgi:hypothetical protein
MERGTLKENPEHPQEEQSPMGESHESLPAEVIAGFPEEPFACPHCGQMLGPACRVCVSCKQPIDPRDIKRPAQAVTLPELAHMSAPVEPAHFSWGIFFSVLMVWFAIAVACEYFLGYEKGQFVLGGLVIVSSAWVLYDANRKNIPKGLRWSAGALLLWIVVFPWYLSRRSTPKAPCPLVEAETSRFSRVLLIVLMVVFLLGALAVFFKSPKLH